MKVVHSIARNFAGDGLGYIAYQRVRELYRQGFLKKIIAPSFSKNEIDASYCLKLSLSEIAAKVLSKCFSLGLNGSYLVSDRVFDWNASYRLPVADIFHGWSSQALFSLRKAKTKGQFTFLERPNSHPLCVQDIMETEYKKYRTKQPFMSPKMLEVEVKELAAADFVIVPSQFAYRSFTKRMFDPNKLLFVPFGVDIERFKPYARPVNDEIFRIVFVGQIGLRKGVQYLLKAFSELKLENSELTLTGWLNPDIIEVLKQYRSIPNIKIESFTLDTCRTYNSASICVFPSVEDGFGLVVLEAMACGKPVIVTENTGAKDVITEGVDGFVIASCDEEAIKKKILYFYENKEILKTMGEAARKKACLHTWEKSSQKLITYYKEALKANAADIRKQGI